MIERIALYGALTLSALGAAYVKGRSDEQAKQMEAKYEQMHISSQIRTKIVTKWVERIKVVNRDVPTVSGRIAGLCEHPAVRDSGGVSGTDAEAPDHAGTDQLAAEVIQAVDAVDQCQALIDYIKGLNGSS